MTDPSAPKTPPDIAASIAASLARLKIENLTRLGLTPDKIGKDVYDVAGLPFPG